MKIFIRYLSIISFCFSLAFAAGQEQYFGYVCMGYGDNLSGDGQQSAGNYQDEVTMTNEAECKDGCYVNCFYTKGNPPQGDVMSFLQQDGKGHYLFKPEIAKTKINTFFYCPKTSGNCRASGDPFKGYSQSCYTCFPSSFLARGSGGIVPEPSPEVTSSDIIVEEDSVLGTKTQNMVNTKTTGSTLKLRIYHKDNSGSFGSGLNDASCSLYRGGAMVENARATWSAWSGGGAYIFTSNNLTQAGQYSVQCIGISKDGKALSSLKLPFYVAPDSYSASLTIDVDGRQIPILTSPYKATSNGADYQFTLHGAQGSSVVTKIDQSIVLKLTGTANKKDGTTDIVNSEMTGTAEITADGLNGGSGGAAICKVPLQNQTISGSTKITNGSFDGQTHSIKFDEVYKGRIVVKYTDDAMKKNIDNEKARGGCNGNGNGNGQCPYPPVFKFVFDFQVVPTNFEVKVYDKNNKDIKVMYYGQGSSPLNESPVKLQVIPLGNNNQPLKNFISGCAAIDTDLQLNSNSGNSSGNNNVVITFVDPNTTTSNASVTTIRASEFTTGANGTAIADLSKILSVKINNSFTTSMVAEPLILNGNMNPLMYFTGKKDTILYPQYTPIFTSLANSVILRGRINMIDADNATNPNTMPTSKVYYEFYCQTCNLAEVSKATGVTQYSGSPTSPGWWIDTTFSSNNSSSINNSNISIKPTGLNVSSVSNFADGIQNIGYQQAAPGKYEVKINQGLDANNFPLFLLYDPYGKASGTDAFVTIYQGSSTESRDFGVDIGADGKNQRSGSRTGGF